MKCLEALDSTEAQEDEPTNDPDIDMLIVDAPTLVHMLLPENDTFLGYCQKVIKYIEAQFQKPNVRRVDIVFDVYKSDSLKSGTVQKEEKGHVVGLNLPRKCQKTGQTF
jgi:uncharacterized protein YjaZ